VNFDVAIVGWGIVGAACADALAAEGLSVIVVGGPGTVSAATAAGMGHIVVMDDSEAQFALTAYSQKLWDDLSDKLPREAEFGRCGTLWIAADEEELAEAERKREYYTGRGPHAEILDERSLREAEPGLREGLAGALLVPGDSVVYQPFVSAWLLERAKKNGAVVAEPTVIISVVEGSVEDWSGDRVNADSIIIATGCGSTELVPSLKIRPRKGHLVITGRTGKSVNHQLVELGYLKSAHGTEKDSVAFNIQPRSTGQLLIGSSRQYESEDDSVDFDIVRRMMQRAIEYFPAAAGTHATRIWTGFRPATPDGLPYIGKVPGHEKVYAATGHEGLGITTSLGTAALIVDEILGRTSEIPREPYSPARIDA
jgi:glycine/D-amino acid oxidase-like deaminating enzyme